MIITLISAVLLGLFAWYVVRSKRKDATQAVVCPRCHKADATMYSGGRKVCLECAYEEHT